MSDKLNLSDITKYIKSFINFNQIKTPKAKHSGPMVGGPWFLIVK